MSKSKNNLIYFQAKGFLPNVDHVVRFLKSVFEVYEVLIFLLDNSINNISRCEILLNSK